MFIFFRDRTLDLELSLENVNKPKVLWTGCISRKLGLIEPAGSIDIELECVPQDTAIQVVSGVCLIDTRIRVKGGGRVSQIYAIRQGHCGLLSKVHR